MATRQNHTQRHATIEDRLDALLDAEMARKARRHGHADPRAYLKAQAAAARRAKRQAQQARRDAAYLISQHVNTCPPPTIYHAGQNICRGEFPRVAKPEPVVAIVPKRETPPEVAEFIRRFRVAHSNDVDALDALIREVAA